MKNYQVKIVEFRNVWLVFLVFLLPLYLKAVTYPTAGTAPGLQPDMSLGSRQISEFEHLNYFNGNLNFIMPRCRGTNHDNPVYRGLASLDRLLGHPEISNKHTPSRSVGNSRRCADCRFDEIKNPFSKYSTGNLNLEPNK